MRKIGRFKDSGKRWKKCWGVGGSLLEEDCRLVDNVVIKGERRAGETKKGKIALNELDLSKRIWGFMVIDW